MTQRFSFPLVVLGVGAWLVAADPAAAQVDVSDLPQTLRPALECIDADSVQATVSYLASDELAGRDTPSPGLELAAQYIEQRFTKAGLLPLTEGGGYRHPVQLPGVATPDTPVDWSWDLDGTLFDVEEAARFSLAYGVTARARSLEGRGLYFVGSPGAMLQVDRGEARGKIAVILHGMPLPADMTPPDSEVPLPEIRTAQLSQFLGFASLSGAIYLYPPTEAGRAAYDGDLKQSRTPRLTGRGPRASPPVFIAHSDALWNAVLSAMGTTEAKALTQGVAPAVMEGSFEAELPAVESKDVVVDNLIGILPGRDPALRDEYLLVTAHYDHVGVGGSGEDRIFNGADDNATGTTAVLHLADALSALEARPRRSLAFIGFCAEEKGLLGSRAFAKAPPIPLEQIVGNVNIEMIGRPDDIVPGSGWVTGYQYSDLGPLMAEAAATLDIAFGRHEQLGDQLFRASDNYPLAEKGIPAHSISAGSLHDDYHQVTDEVRKLDVDHMARIIGGLCAGVFFLAERDDQPAWNLEEAQGRDFAERRGR